MSQDGRAVANFVLDLCDSAGRQLAHLSLQKIVFFCQVWSLVKLHRRLIKHDFQAWQYGPVLQYLYREFREFEDKPINRRASRINTYTGKAEIVTYEFDCKTEELLKRVIDFYSRLPASTLVALSHVEGGPWFQAWHHRGAVNPGMVIEESSLVSFYSKAPPPFSIQ